MTSWVGKRADEDLRNIEDSLTRSLGSVEPDQQFIGHLRSRLTRKPEIELEKSNYLAAYLVAGMGLFIGISAFWILGQIFRGLRAFLFRA